MKTLKEVALDVDKALILKQNGGQDEISSSDLRERMDLPEGYKALQEIVGGLFEFVYIDDWIMVVNENGLINGSHPNPEASKYADIIVFGTCLLIHKKWIK